MSGREGTLPVPAPAVWPGPGSHAAWDSGYGTNSAGAVTRTSKKRERSADLDHRDFIQMKI